MKIITVANQKGGVGKTTTALALSGILGRKGLKVLLIDVDAQGNASLACGGNEGLKPSISAVLLGDCKSSQAIIGAEDFDIIPSDQNLPSTEQKLMQKMNREYRLHDALSGLEYDYIIIDTPPQLSILTINALTACDDVIIPASADIFSLQGIGQVLETIEGIRQYTNSKIVVTGILLTKYSDRTTLSKDVKELIGNFAKENGTRLFETKIRETVAVRESQIEQRSLCEYLKATALKDYEALVDELGV